MGSGGPGGEDVDESSVFGRMAWKILDEGF